MYGKGISREGSLLDIGVDLGIVKKSGAWYTYEGEQLGQGRENAKAFLIENPEIMVEISERIRTQVGIGHRTTRRGREPTERAAIDLTTSPSASTIEPGLNGRNRQDQSVELLRRTTLSTIGAEWVREAPWKRSRFRRDRTRTPWPAPIAGAVRASGRRRDAGRRSRGAEPGDQGGGDRPWATWPPPGIDLVCIPTFADIEIDGERRTAIRLSVEDRQHRRAEPLPHVDIDTIVATTR